MTYHPRFEAAVRLHAAGVWLSAATLAPNIGEATAETDDSGNVLHRSANNELGLAEAQLRRLFPDESFAEICVAPSRLAMMGLLTVFAALLAIVGARTIL
jgi:hypothetical protein